MLNPIFTEGVEATAATRRRLLSFTLVMTTLSTLTPLTVDIELLNAIAPVSPKEDAETPDNPTEYEFVTTV